MYHIPERNLGRLQHEIQKLNRRATRLGVPQITITIGSFRDVPIPQDELSIEPQQFTRLYDVEVVGETPRFAGWTFGATIEHTEEGNVLRKCPGIEVELTAYREVRPQCDHCQTNRSRRDTYVVINESGLHKQVGRNCLRDFLGHQNPETLAKQAELMFCLGELCDMSENDERPHGARDRRVSLHGYLSHVATITFAQGFLTGKQARQRSEERGIEAQSTASLAWSNMFPMPRQTPIPVTEQASEYAQKAIDFVLEQFAETPRESLNDFQHNMLVLASCVTIEPRNGGLAAYFIAFYQRETERATERAAALPSNHFGELKKRYRNVTLKYLNTFDMSNEFGERMLHKFMDDSGNVYVWKTTKPLMYGWPTRCYEVNQAITLTFSVKAHNDFRGVKQTVITRCEIHEAPATTAPTA